MIPSRKYARDNATLERSACVCAKGSPVPPLWALGLAVLTLLLSATLALVPFGIHVCISESCDSTYTTRGVYLERCEAIASQLTPGDTAKEFIKKMAQASGMAAGDLVTATLGIAAVGSGMALASSQGQQWGMTAADALSNVVEAADYPDYDSLSTEQQNLWGSKENYDSAKYVSLMNGLGFETEFQRFEQFDASGGGNFEFTDDVQDRLNQFYRIGSLWQSRLGVMFGDIAGLITNMDLIKQFPVGTPVTEGFTYDGTNDENWPTGVPRILSYSQTNLVMRYYNNREYPVFYTNEPVYVLIGRYGSTLMAYGFSKTAFTHSNNNVTYTAATYDGDQEQPMYYYNLRQLSVNSASTYNVATNVFTSNNAVMNSVLKRILYSSDGSTTTESDSIVDYPDGDVSNNQRIYYPEGGVKQDTPWSEFTNPQTPIRNNDTPYNPDNQTQTVQWQTQTEENVLPLLDIKFDKLFPFSMLSDIPKLFDKVELLTSGEAASGVYNRVEIPMNWGQDHEDVIVLDLAWLYDLLNMIRPAMQVLLVAVLLITCIEFWRGILTG